MKRIYLYILTALSAVMATASAYFIYIGDGISAGLSATAAVLFIEYGAEKSVSLKNRNYIKAFNSTSMTAIEAIIIGGLLASHGLPDYLIVAAFAGLVILKSLKNNAESYNRDGIDLKFGRRGRVAIAVLAMFLSTLNSYYVFIAAFVILGTMVFDAGQLLYSIRSKENSSKLKERILSR